MLKIWDKLNNTEKFIIIAVITLLVTIGLTVDATTAQGIVITTVSSVIIAFIAIAISVKIIASICQNLPQKDNAKKQNIQSNNTKSNNIELTCDLNSLSPYVISSSGDRVMLKNDYIFISKGKGSKIANCIVNNTWEAIDAVELKIPLDVITVINYKDSGMYKGYLEFIYHGYNVRPRDVIKHLQENIVTFNTEEEAKNFSAFKEIVEDKIKQLKSKHKNNGLSVADELKKLADLKQQGILTEEEFLLQKKKLMGQ